MDNAKSCLFALIIHIQESNPILINSFLKYCLMKGLSNKYRLRSYVKCSFFFVFLYSLIYLLKRIMKTMSLERDQKIRLIFFSFFSDLFLCSQKSIVKNVVIKRVKKTSLWNIFILGGNLFQRVTDVLETVVMLLGFLLECNLNPLSTQRYRYYLHPIYFKAFDLLLDHLRAP